MRRCRFRIPIIFVVIHAVAIVGFWCCLSVSDAAEAGVAWQVVFGTINFPAYYLLDVPQFIAVAGDAPTSLAYPAWFGLVGSIQWFSVGLVIALLCHRVTHSHCNRRVRE